MMSKKITPFLWFNNNALEAAEFYVSLFKNSKIIDRPKGDAPVTSVTFILDGQEMVAFNGGPHFTFTPAISLFMNCETQEEVDVLWNKFLENGGKESQCGWLNDKYGLSWQIIPSVLGKMLQDNDREKSGRVMQAMLKMHKIDIALLQKAYDNK